MPEANLTPRGYQQITSLASAVGLTLPTATGSPGPRMAVIQAESKSVRWRDDGTNPTTSVGTLLEAGSDFLYTGDLTRIKFIETAASAKLNVSFYR